jgi:uncharacterized protein (TIGR01777 family)
LIGSALADALLARGDEVVGLTRDPVKAKPKNPTVRWFAWNAATERPPAPAFAEVDAVVNLVGEEINQRLTEAAKARIRDSRVTASHNLIQGIEAAGAPPRVFVGGSAIGYYGDRGAKILDEESQKGEGFGADIPDEWERAQREAEGVAGRVVILRTGLVLSRHGGLVKQLLLPFKLGLGGPLVGGEQYMSWIQIADEVGLILWAIDNESVSGVINATAPNPVTNKEFTKAFGAAVGRPAVIPVPKLALVALRGSELTETITGSARIMPRRALDGGYRFRYTEIEPALRAAVQQPLA